MILPHKLDEQSFLYMFSSPFWENGLPKIQEFLKISGSPIEDTLISDISDFTLVVGKVIEIIARAKSLELVDIEEHHHPSAENIMLRRYFLTAKGVDVALKLQEHIDNERRFGSMQFNTKRTFYISLTALAVAMVAAWFNYQRLDLYEQHLNQLENKGSAIIKLPTIEQRTSNN